jgi:exopolysaccharide production protein ExoQ
MSRSIDAPQSPVPAWHLTLAWIILLPFLYMATNGKIIPDNGDVSMSMAEAGGSSFSHQLGLGITCLLCSALVFSRLPKVFAFSMRSKIILALPALALLSSAWSESGRQSLVSGTTLLVFTLFALYIASCFDTSGQFELLMLAGGVALLLSLALVVLAPGLGAPGKNWRGIFGHKQNCSAVCTLLLVTAIHWRPTGFSQRAFRAFYALMSLAMIIMSQSRTGWALALIAIGLSFGLAVLQKMSITDALVICFCIFIVVALLTYGVYENAAVLLPAVGKDATLSERTVIWAAVWTVILKQPLLGYGYGAFWTGLQGPSLNIVIISGWALAQAQNGFLDMWLQVGLGGVVLIALATAQAIKNALYVFRYSGEDRFVRWCIVVIITTLLYNIGESSLGMIQLVWFLFLLACLGLNVVAGSKAQRLAAEHQHGGLLERSI